MKEILADTFSRIVHEHCSTKVVRDIENGTSADSLWQVIESTGFPDALIPEQSGGPGLSMEDAFPIFELCGASALPVPLAETMVARALISSAGDSVPAGPIALASGTVVNGTLRCERVTFGAVARHVLVFTRCGRAALLSVDSALRSPDLFPLDARVEWPIDGKWTTPFGAIAHVDVHAIRATLCSAQLAGVMQRAFHMTLVYANDRTQFGRAIGKFQAIQHQLSVMAEKISSARMAALLSSVGTPETIERANAAIAKALTSEAARDVAAIAHAVHGAIGFTEEFDLQLFTRRLYWLRQAAGAEGFWQDVLGGIALSRSDRAIDMLREFSDVRSASR